MHVLEDDASSCLMVGLCKTAGVESQPETLSGLLRRHPHESLQATHIFNQLHFYVPEHLYSHVSLLQVIQMWRWHWR